MARDWDWETVDWDHFDRQFEHIHEYLVKVEEAADRDSMTAEEVQDAIADLKRSVVAVTHVVRMLYQHVREQRKTSTS